MGKPVGIVGVGQTHHASKRLDLSGTELISEAVTRALDDAGINASEIDAFVIGNMDHFENINYVDAWATDGLGSFMKPVFKVTTGGTTGNTVAACAYYHVASGLFETVMGVGWEKNSESDTQAAIATCANPVLERDAFAGAIGPLAAEYSMYMGKYGATEEDAAIVAARDRNNALNNPYAHNRMAVTVQDVMSSPMLSYPIKLLDMCPRSDGACAVIFTSEEKAKRLCPRPAWIHTSVVRHDYTYLGDLEWHRLMSLESASAEAYRLAGITDPVKEFDVAELYLPVSTCGVKWMDSLGFCEMGGAPELVRKGVTDMDGELPVNPSGGVISTNPIGATAMIRVGEAAWQIMERAGDRQVPNVKKALATGYGGCAWSNVMIMGADTP
ncbi:MAG: thiolase family protein [Actinobacteria bacterium]|nr:thiolase family protein [Actinomycetota bacterium]MCG2818082.1 thiolase family protein [Actinomycetes bacterium]MBU4179765.1 thiolase family protein [Actinomycetota bacterium]MBU4218335.1 thiolase family protein [Actinomycetota bacterium]MBU4359079.1 thiolase family protein [Actinomycetota bacterium]